jgi:Protein of unknown function (DUF1566)
MQKHMLSCGSVLMVALGLWVLLGWRSSAEAVITIRSAEVVNGAAVVQGGNAARGAAIFWEGIRVTQANNGGNFAFQGEVPADCVGRLEDGVPADAVDVALANCTPVPPVEFPAPVPRTGQTTSYATGDDGDLQAGVPFPTPRFTNQGNGTVRDNLTGLIWLQQAHCSAINSGPVLWVIALSRVSNLADGQCDLTDGSAAGDWRLPNIKELRSLIDFNFFNPALSNAAGTGQCTATDCAFSGVAVNASYWSSTTHAENSDLAWTFLPIDGRPGDNFKDHTGIVWPVRGPE